MYNVRKKCIEKILWGKTEALLKFDKSFFLAEIGCWLCHIMIFLNPVVSVNFFVSCDGLIYTENFA